MSAEELRRLVQEGRSHIGQLQIISAETGFEVRHRDDGALPAEGLELLDEARASELAQTDVEGKYRPLKTAPNLRRGWRLIVRDAITLRATLDCFYPGRLAAWSAWSKGQLRTTPLRETLERQTGMYRVAQKITDAQATELVASFCRSDGGCLRTILWKRDAAGAAASDLLPSEKFDPLHDQTGHNAQAIPLLCQEACNLLVAEARAVVKSKADSFSSAD
jgi:sirohydrochlorin cobaltochelatase